MGRPSLRILAQAGLSGVFFAAKILRGEIPRYWLPLPEFAANFVTCSYLLKALPSLFREIDTLHVAHLLLQGRVIFVSILVYQVG